MSRYRVRLSRNRPLAGIAPRDPVPCTGEEKRFRIPKLPAFSEGGGYRGRHATRCAVPEVTHPAFAEGDSKCARGGLLRELGILVNTSTLRVQPGTPCRVIPGPAFPLFARSPSEDGALKGIEADIALWVARRGGSKTGAAAIVEEGKGWIAHDLSGGVACEEHRG